MNVFIIPLLMVMLKMKSTITSTIPEITIGIIINKWMLEHCLQSEEPKTVLKSFLQYLHSAPDLLNIHCISGEDKLIYDACGIQ